MPGLRLFGTIGDLVRATVVAWWEGDSLQLGAALAYYTMFSIAPVLVVAIAVAGLVLGPEVARGAVVDQLRELVGPAGARTIQTILEEAYLDPGAGRRATLFGLATILIGASGAFGQLQQALNEIWEVDHPPGGVAAMLRRRLLSFGTVLIIGFLLLVSMVVSAAVASFDRFVSQSLPAFQPLAAALQTVASLAIATVLFAAIFKILPDRDIGWGDVWVGGAVTALLFELGKSAIGLYLGNTGIVSVYGAAGSLVVLLLWVYYSSQIVFLGAEFTNVWTRRRRRELPPIA